MSTRIGITLDQELYDQYKEMLWRQKKTIQDDLKERVEEAVREYFRNKEQ